MHIYISKSDLKQSIIMLVLLITVPVGIYKWHEYQVQANNYKIEQGVCYRNQYGNVLCPQR